MKALARFTIRRATGSKRDLILGSMMNRQDGKLIPGRIYQIEECLGELIILDVGESAIGDTGKKSLSPVSWVNSVDEILEIGTKIFNLTKEEYQSLCKKYNVNNAQD